MTAEDLSFQAAADEGSVACFDEAIFLHHDLDDFDTTGEVREVDEMAAWLETVYAGPEMGEYHVQVDQDLWSHVALSIAVLVLDAFEMSKPVERLSRAAAAHWEASYFEVLLMPAP